MPSEVNARDCLEQPAGVSRWFPSALRCGSDDVRGDAARRAWRQRAAGGVARRQSRTAPARWNETAAVAGRVRARCAAAIGAAAEDDGRRPLIGRSESRLIAPRRLAPGGGGTCRRRRRAVGRARRRRRRRTPSQSPFDAPPDGRGPGLEDDGRWQPPSGERPARGRLSTGRRQSRELRSVDRAWI